MKSPTLGTYYTRRQIRDMIGGGDLVSYLPGRNGVALAGCFVPKKNRRAPVEVDVGPGVQVIKRARALGSAKSVLPVFVKEWSDRWEYVGMYRCLSFSDAVADIHAYGDRRKDAVGVLYFEAIGDSPEDSAPDPALIEVQGKEGKKRLRSHFARERRRGLLLAKRREARAIHGCLVCEACGVQEGNLPEEIGVACFECHHKTPLSKLAEENVTKLVDLALVCANCHRMIHRSDPMITVEHLSRLLGSLTFRA